ncbi:MAG: hypothetical protein WCG83_05530 [Candidatus Peregrinibacteria bacterium]
MPAPLLCVQRNECIIFGYLLIVLHHFLHGITNKLITIIGGLLYL